MVDTSSRTMMCMTACAKRQTMDRSTPTGEISIGAKMSIKTFCSSYCKFFDNVFVHSYSPRLFQPFDGHLEIRDNSFVDDLTPAEAENKFFPGMRFGLAGDFPAWLQDPM